MHQFSWPEKTGFPKDYFLLLIKYDTDVAAVYQYIHTHEEKIREEYPCQDTDAFTQLCVKNAYANDSQNRIG